MRCLSCNKILNKRESTRKYSSNGSFVDLCDRCYSYVADDIASVEGEGYVEDVTDEEETSESQQGWNWGNSTEEEF